MTDKDLERTAVIEALKARQKAGIGDDLPICPYDFAMKGGAGVRFIAVSSMEGVYERQSRTIIISSLRPRGRRAFTCAHEYGHFIFGHGTHVDELAGNYQTLRPPEELMANCFAGFLLMPRHAIITGFKNFGVQPSKCTPIQAYAISCWLGVSYDAFLTHASLAVGVMPNAVAEHLKKISPKEIKAQIARIDVGVDLLIVDQNWKRAVDLVVGDMATLPAGSITEGSVTELVWESDDVICIRATSRGIGRAVCDQWAANIRVMPAEYTGLARCRHLPEENVG